jgi:hypothetical protein
MAVTPDGRVWIGSAPDYGLLGGTLAWYDPATGARGSHRHLVPDCTPCALAWVPALGRLLVGISTEAGTGAEVRAKQGAFVLWDPALDAAEWTGDFGIENLPDVLSLALAADGVVVALLGRFPFVAEGQKGAPVAPFLAWIKPGDRSLLGTAALPADWGTLPHNGHHALRATSDGMVYGALTGCIYTVGDPGEVTPFWTAADGQVDVLGPVIGDRLYFASGWRLRSVPRVPRVARD